MPVGKQGENLYKEIDWDAMTITNNFLFQEVLRNKDLCKQLLESILHIQIKDVRYPQTEKSMTAQLRSKGIRLDVYVTDKENNVYDVEMQSAGNRSVLYRDMDEETVIKELPLRVRYYQSIISTNMLRKGRLYGELRKSYVIFVCSFDPFGKGLPVYHFTYRCSEDISLQMNDKTECIFLNSKSVKKAEDKELAAFLAYVNGKAAATAFTKKLDKEATRIKNREEWRLKIMTLDMEIEMMKRRTAEKAKQEGKQEGKLEERKAVAMEMIKNGEPLEKILQYSKLTEAAIRKLAKSMGAAVL
ncbi:MAG: Rpn family recombination-promoting nuclease/putative transposase [Acidaminococcaceae bacterium]|nr:Rpn family recombination-promoting nuclease/putative transposase [Acidaminococcaceae bacterium]